jgi:phospholipid/cholesterol/gamma-HCH transport system permease protein
VNELVLHVRDQVTGIARTFALTLYYTFRGRLDRRAVLVQMFEIGNRSLFFILVTLAFLGAILNFQTSFQAKRLIGDVSLVGPAELPLLMRNLGPALCGLMVATRVGTGIAAEIGSMVVTEQVDALRMCNAQPVDYLVKPRFIASIVMIPVLSTLGILTAWMAGLLVSVTVFQVNPATYLNFNLVHLSDALEGFTKTLVFGMTIPVIAAHSGFEARGGSEGVGSATTQSVVNASLAVIILDFLIGGIAFVIRAG